jgi:hypothetical protein
MGFSLNQPFHHRPVSVGSFLQLPVVPDHRSKPQGRFETALDQLAAHVLAGSFAGSKFGFHFPASTAAGNSKCQSFGEMSIICLTKMQTLIRRI